MMLQKNKNIYFLICLKWITLLSIFIALCGSIFINFELYKRNLKTQLDPTGKWLNLKDIPKLGVSNLLFGDSRISQWSTNLPCSYSFAYGFSGFTSEQLKLGLYSTDIPSNIKSVIIQVGINDLKSLAFMEFNAELVKKRVFYNIKAIANYFVERDIKVIILTIIPTKNIVFPRSLIWSNLIDESIDDVNKKLLSLINIDIQVFDLSKEFKSKDYLYKDTLHLNHLGYQLLNQVIQNKINCN